MSVGLLFGAFWFGLGVLMWWWPAAVFLSFNNEDVTPDARGFGVGAIFFGAFFLSTSVPELGARFTFPGTVLTVGVLMLLHPVPIPGADPEGPVTSKIAGVCLTVVGGVLILRAVL